MKIFSSEDISKSYFITFIKTDNDKNIRSKFQVYYK